MKLVITIQNLTEQDVAEFTRKGKIKKEILARVIADTLSLACDDNFSEFGVNVEIKKD